MAKRRVMKSEQGIELSEVILFGGQPRTRIGTRYIVSTPRRPDGKTFDTVDEAAAYFHVQLSLSGGRSVSPAPERASAGRGLGRVGKTA